MPALNNIPSSSILERFNLSGKVVLLTGGNGLYGRGLTADLAAAGATLIIASRDKARSECVAEEERARGFEVFAEQYDQGDEASIIALAARLRERFKRLDGLVNNSVLRPKREGRPMGEALEESMQVNATGLMLMHHHIGALMAEGDGGSIVNIGSIQGMIGPTLGLYEGLDMGTPSPDYFFHKGGMVNLTRYYASMLGSRGVRVNCLSPGGFFNNQPPLFVERYSRNTCLNRMGDEIDLGGPVIFLLSEAARYLTAANIPVDGGYTAI